MQKFNTKPVVVHAAQYFEAQHMARLGCKPGTGVDTRPDPLTGVRLHCHSNPSEWPTPKLDLVAGGRTVVVEDGDWIVVHADKRREVCKPDAFAAIYEPAND